jgi:PAS domain S-box-containing protein
VSVTITDHVGTITYANENFCRISGYSHEELLGRHHRIHFEMHLEFYRDLYHTITSGKVCRGECSKTKDGTVYWVDTTIVSQLGPNGNPVGYLSVRIDIRRAN